MTVMTHDGQTPRRIGPEWREGWIRVGHGRLATEAKAATAAAAEAAATEAAAAATEAEAEAATEAEAEAEAATEAEAEAETEAEAEALTEAVRRITPGRGAIRVAECSLPGSGADGCHSATRNLLRSGI
jgi:hypothetical protein